MSVIQRNGYRRVFYRAKDVRAEIGDKSGDGAGGDHADPLSGSEACGEAAPLRRLRESGSPGGKSFRRSAAPTNLSEVSWGNSSGH